MEVYTRHIVLSVGVSAAVVIWYAYRRWNDPRCRCAFCQPEDQTAHGYIVGSHDLWYRCSQEILDKVESSRVIAFNCYWKENLLQRRKVALIAFSSCADRITFVRLSELGDVPEDLAAILRDPSIVKVGVDVLGNAAKLREDYGIEMNGCLDLRYMAMATPAIKRVLMEIGSDLSLSSLTEILLDVNLIRNYRVYYSDWEAPQLSNEQIYYVTGQAISTFELAVKIARADGIVPRVLGFLLKPYLWLEHFIVNHYAMYFDLEFSLERVTRRTISVRPRPPDDKAMRSYKTLKTPLYDNCVLLCPDMEHLCTCDRRKAQWYLDNNLGEKIKDDPLTVRLKFEPAQRAILDAQYYCLSKRNICVVCGSPDNLVRKYVVPREYRKHFPKIMKHHNAHDILLTCLSCHTKCCWYEDLLKEQFGENCNAPLNEPTRKFNDNKILKSVRNAANALRKARNNLPEERRHQLEALLKQHFEVTELSDELIDFAASIDYREANVDYVSHGKKVVDYFANDGGLLLLETMWREYFVLKMRPAFLPDLWSTDHHHDIIAVKLSFIQEANPDEAESLMKKLGITPKEIRSVIQRLKEDDNVNLSRINFKKGRLLETHPESNSSS